MHRLQVRICALNGFIYAPFWKNEIITNTTNATFNPLHTTADVADQVSVTPPTQGEVVQQQIEFAEVAPTIVNILSQPKSVDITYIESIRSFLQRPYPVSSGTWSGDQLYDTTVSSFDPLKAYLNLSQIYGKLQGFEYIRGGLKIELRVNGTRFHYGQLVCAFTPLGNLRSYTANQLSAASLTMFPGVTVDPSSSEIGSFQVPWCHPFHFATISSTSLMDSLGFLYLKVLVPLQVVNATTVPEVSWSVWVSMVDPVITAFTAQPPATPFLLEEQTSDTAIRVVPEAMNFLTTGSIADVSIASGMNDRNDVSQEEQFIGASRDDMQLSSIFVKPNWLQGFIWSTESVPATNLTTIPVTPNYRDNSRFASNYLYQLSNLADFWRGSLRYHVRFVASGFHSGRVLISWEPSILLSTRSITDYSNRMGIVVDLQQTTDVYFAIPWMSVKPWLPTRGSVNNGVLQFNVLNSLATPSGEPSSITVLVWSYGSNDLEFALPRVSSLQQPAAVQPVLEEQCADQPLADPKFGNLDGSFSVPSKMTMGESLTNIHQFMRKMAYATSSTTPATTTPSGSITFYSQPQLGDDTMHMNWLANMFVVSRGSVRYAGIVTSNTGVVFDRFDVGPSLSMIASTAFSANNLVFGYLQVRIPTPNSMVQVPYYSNVLFHPTKLSITAAANMESVSPGYGMRGFPAASVATSFRYWIGAGDDFMFAYLIPPPNL